MYQSEPGLAGHPGWIRPGLYPTLWPCDHGDVQRSQCSVGGGFAPGVKQEDITSVTNEELYHPLFLYTRNSDELFVYGRAEGFRKGNYFARVDSKTLEVRERLRLPFTPYVGGGLVHENGDVYLVHGTKLYHFAQGRLAAAQVRDLPLVNGFFTVYNGVTVASDGRLITKGWAVTREDVPVVPRRQIALMLLGLLLMVGGILVALVYPEQRLQGVFLASVLPLLVLGGLRRTHTSIRRFLGQAQPGVVVVIDPETLATISQITPPERMAFGRMSLMRTQGGGAEILGMTPATPPVSGQTEWVVMAGDTQVHRMKYDGGTLTLDPGWTELYRKEGDGSTMASAPTPYGDGVYLMDNVSPGRLTAPHFRLFRKALYRQDPIQCQDIGHGKTGFNFWTVAINTSLHHVITWDSLTGQVSAHTTSRLERVWETTAHSTDCITVAGDRGHVYTAIYDGVLGLADFRRMFDVSPPGEGFHKFLLVLNAATGEEILRYPLGQTAPTMSMIMPGIHGDVFVGTRPGLVRVHAR